jgi:proton-translocating NAD(P)+ transhydrogenase subunit alpha
MKLTVLKERRDGEARVAATPETVKKLISLGFSVTVEASAGDASSIPDAAFKEAGAAIAKTAKDAAAGADVILKVQGPDQSEIANLPKTSILAGILKPHAEKEMLRALAKAGITAFAMELMPRISRAQAMDVLSSQSNLAGYKAVLDAASVYGRAFPMMMTAAGTIAPAKVLVMGAGVAGLQAIATARRLGAVVSATDVRLAAKEQVQSLGAKFVMVEDEETKAAETAGGYAKEMSEAYKQKQAALIAETIKKQDIVITTALIPGKPAPRLISKEMVASMREGSVIVDLAVEQGGNCELAKPGETVRASGVTIVGHLNVPSRLAADASALYAKNLLNFVTLLVDKEKKTLALNFEDEILKGTCVTHSGKIVHPQFQGGK